MKIENRQQAIKFIREYLIECEPNTGCGRCDDAIKAISILEKPLLAAGKLALAARLVTTANAKNLSERIIQIENALDIYDNEIINQ